MNFSQDKSAFYHYAFVTSRAENIKVLLYQDPDFADIQEKLSIEDKTFESYILENATEIKGTYFYEFKLCYQNKEGSIQILNCLAVITGVGKINAALGMERLLSIWQVGVVIHFGKALPIEGSGLEENDVIIASSTSFGDVCYDSQYKLLYGNYPDSNFLTQEYSPVFYFHRKFVEKFYKLLKNHNFSNVHLGHLINIDQEVIEPNAQALICKSAQIAIKSYNNYLDIRDAQPLNILAYDNESAACAKVAEQYQRSIIVLKEIADINKDEEDDNPCSYLINIFTMSILFFNQFLDYQIKKSNEIR